MAYIQILLAITQVKMYVLIELVFRSTSFTLGVLEEVKSKVIEQLQTSGSTVLVRIFRDSIAKGNHCYWNVFVI